MNAQQRLQLREGTLHGLLAAQAARYGDRTFLLFQESEFSFAELHRLVEQTAAGLHSLGHARGERIALLLPNRPEFIALFFAAARLGCPLVPVNPALTPEEIRYIVENAEARTLVTLPTLWEKVRGIRESCPALRHVILLDEAGGEGVLEYRSLIRETAVELPDEVRPEDTAAILYTSGTTGKPKGVLLTHGNYLFDTWAAAEVLPAGPDDRFMCILPLFHVNAQVVTVLYPLLCGSSLLLTEGFSPRTFFQDIARHRVTRFSAVPTIYSILLTLPEIPGLDLSSLRQCICGAAPMPVEVFERFEKRFGATIIEGYGLTEGTCASTVNPPERRKIGSIGRPLPETEMAIHDDDGRELPAGEVGEIVTRGRNVMQGYWKNPQATAETLSGGWLRSGDLARRDEEGYYYIVGRKKDMIIRGGENIYPREIEELLHRHPAVQEAAVIGEPDEIWGERVKACVVLKAGAAASAEELMDFCRQRLAAYKCPEAVEFLEQFPKTATGKIQKNLLRAM